MDASSLVELTRGPDTAASAANAAERFFATLGKHTTCKGCLYIKKLADVDQEVLEALVVKSVAAKRSRHPG